MRFSYLGLMIPPEYYVPLAKAVEQAGWDGFTLSDSICYPKVASSKYPYFGDGSREFLEDAPVVEPFCTIPALAAVTEKLEFTTSVVKLPIRNPVLVAKQLSTIAVLANNRINFGVGLSPWPEDFEICGERWERRGKRMDEMIEIIRRLLRGGFFGGWDSEFYQIPDCKICPVPSKPVPILISGHSEAALKRAARIGDGWIGAGCSLEELSAMIEMINHWREEFGTRDKPFEIIHTAIAGGFSSEDVKRYKDLGVTETIISFTNVYSAEPDRQTLNEKIDILSDFADTVIHR